jgi:hypothetical protein
VISSCCSLSPHHNQIASRELLPDPQCHYLSIILLVCNTKILVRSQIISNGSGLNSRR